MENKKTVIIGATTNPSRYAFMAAALLKEYGHDFVPIGTSRGEVFGKAILDIRGQPVVQNVDTVTLYIGAGHQPEWYRYLLELKPKRVIFNPGTENPELENLLAQHHIETVYGCTLVMLRTGQY